MQPKALIVDSSRLFQNIIEKIMSTAGVKSFIYTTSVEALEAEHDEYAFILVSRTLSDLTGEIFLKRFSIQHGLGNALTILLTSDKEDVIQLENKDTGFELVFSKINIESLLDVITKEVNSRSLDVGGNILLVEDLQSAADLTMQLFNNNNNNSRITHVNKISTMKQAFLKNEFELIITDYYLENKETGVDVIIHVRGFEDSIKANTPILVISSETNLEKRTEILRNGANDFILKPYHNDELLVRASNLIAHRKLLLKSQIENKKLMKLALTDHLTGLYNRHSLYDLGPKYISHSHRHLTPLCLLMIDLDHFKRINDTRGHSVGDIVLQSVSAVFQDSCRTEDIAARFGGEEFIILLSNCDIENATQKAEKIRTSIEKLKPEGLTITCSIGVSELSAGDNFDALFDRADKAVYVAKDTGRNKVVID